MSVRPSALALTPLLLFLALFFGAGLYYTAQGEAMGFYQLRAPVAILPALALGLWLARRRRLPAQSTLLAGMGDGNIMLTCVLFLLAGAVGVAIYFKSAKDFLICFGLFIVASILLPGLGSILGWCFAPCYGAYRAISSNENLGR